MVAANAPLAIQSRAVPLSKYKKATISVKGKKIKVYVAGTREEQEVGLMFVKNNQLLANEGMIFVNKDEQYRIFWMKNTVIPLDIAYLRSNGTIINILTMRAYDESQYPSDAPAMYAVEMHAKWYAKHGVKRGDKFDLSGLKRAK